MAKNKKTPKEAMRYWLVGFGSGIKIKARTARVAVRKWMRYNLGSYLARNEDLFWMSEDYQKKYIKACNKEAKSYDIKDIPVRPYDKN